MRISRLTLGKVALAWAAFLWAAAMILPQLGPGVQAKPAVKITVAVLYASLLIGTPISLFAYFEQAWRRAGGVPNNAAYAIWLTLENVAAVAVLALLAYPAITFAVVRLR